MLMTPNTQKIRKGFFKKSLSVGHHNVRYTQKQLELVILNCVRGLESFEEGADAPSPQTLRDRLQLSGDWFEYFHDKMKDILNCLVKRFPRTVWRISIDETYEPFFGDRKKANKWLIEKHLGEFIHGYRTKTPGATGSFCFLVISLCCSRIRIPIAVKMVAVKENYRGWVEQNLRQALRIIPQAPVLADRGFGKSTWFYLMLEGLKAKYDVRIPLRKKENKNKVASGVKKFQYWMKDKTTKEEVLLNVYVAKDEQNKEYFLASNLQNQSPALLLALYMNRWDIENLFKDSDRVELPTSSRNPRMRLFCVVLSLFLFTLWQFERVFEKLGESIRRFVKNCIDALCQSMECIITSSGRLLKTFNLKPNS